MIPSASCGWVNQSAGIVIEGFAGGATQAAINRIRANGGTLQYVAMDEPFQHAHDACGWTGAQTAANAMTSLSIVKAAFPKAVIGDIEVVPDGADSTWLQDYAGWMDAFQTVTGSKLGFFDCDTGFLPGWMPAVASLRAETAQRGIPLGIIYDGLSSDSSNEQWTTDAQQMFTEFELSNGQPDQAIFQSWDAYPLNCLPETTPYTFTWLIDQYVLPRPSLSLSLSSTQAAGKLADAQGNAIASAPVSVTMQPTSGAGIIATYTLTGTVPSTVSNAIIQVCVNLCSTDGANQMSLYSYQYSDSGNKATLNFSKGLAGWGVDGSGTASVQLGSDAGGPFLGISATAAQSTWVNSSNFTITPGSAYTLTVTARISPNSTASGYFALIFLIGTEVSRDTLDFATGTATLGSTQTGGDGSYSVQFAPVDTDGAFQVTAYYAGSTALWPAQATAPLSLAPMIPANGIVNGANFQAEALSPGAWFTITGQNLGSAAQWTSPNTVTLGDASVSVCGVPAVLSYNSGPVVTNGTAGWQLNALVPAGVAGQSSCPVIVTVDGVASPPVNASIKAGIMESFVFTSASGALPIVTHSDYSLVGPSSAGLNPAKPGEEVIAWGTGDCTLPSVTVGTTKATVPFSGQVAAGLCQINFSVPEGLSGSNPLQISSSTSPYVLWITP